MSRAAGRIAFAVTVVVLEALHAAAEVVAFFTRLWPYEPVTEVPRPPNERLEPPPDAYQALKRRR